MQGKFPVLIPMRDGHYLSKDVLYGLAFQSLDLEIYPLTREPLPGDSSHGYLCQAENRNLLFKIAETLPAAEYVFMMDADKEILSHNVFEKMVNRLMFNDTFGACFLTGYHDDNSAHIDIGCFCIRKSLIPEIKFFSANKHTCNCNSLIQQIKNAGFNCNVICDKNLIRHKEAWNDPI